MLQENDVIYFLVNGYVMEGKAKHIQGDIQAYTFEIDGYGGCGGPHQMHSSQLHHTIFLTKQEAEKYQDQEAMYLNGHC